MYDLRGLYMHMLFTSGFCVIISIPLLISDKFWIKSERRKKENKKEILIFSLCAIISIFFMCNDIYTIKHPEIMVSEVYFWKEYRTHGITFSKDYWFEDENNQKEVFILDTFSKKKIYPDEFQKDKKY